MACYLLPNRLREGGGGGGRVVVTTFTSKGTNRVHIGGNAPKRLMGSGPFCYCISFGICLSGVLDADQLLN